jgi:hypothetical protein
MQARTATMALSSKKTYPMSPIFRGFSISYAGLWVLSMPAINLQL